MGYQAQELCNGFTMSGPTFVSINDSGINIQNIVVNGSNIDEGSVSIQTLTSTGRTKDLYIYYGKDIFDDNCPAGWYDDDGLVDVSFGPGQGLWIGAPDSETTLTFSGAVDINDTVIPLQNGFTATANVTPVALSIQDIVVNGSNIDEGSVSIQTLTSTGRTDKLYIYYGDDIFDDNCPAGWYDDDGLVDATFEPGQGLWVGASDSETTIRLPAVEL